MPQQLYLAANLVPQTVVFGHLQIVYEDAGGNLLENETTSPGFPYFFGDWAYPTFGRRHDTEANTPNYGDPQDYAIVALALRPEQTAEHVWELMGQIHASLSTGGHGLDYDVEQNSNSYATSVLSVVGIDIGLYLDAVKPPDVSSFPGDGTNILQGAKTGGLFSGYDTPIPLTLAGTEGHDHIVTGIGDDDLGGAGGDDVIHSGAGNDRLNGGLGSDKLNGGTGNDLLEVDQSAAGDVDTLNGGAHTDTADFAGFGFGIWVGLDYAGGLEAWTKDDASGLAGVGPWREIADLNDVENLTGTGQVDSLIGDVGDNVLNGLGSNDVLDGGVGGSDHLVGETGHDTFILGASVAGEIDTFDGGSGRDTADFSGFGFGVWVGLDYAAGLEAWTKDDASGQPGVGPWREIADLNGVENVTGTARVDWLTGDGRANTLDGGLGNDVLSGGAGSDRLLGGAGNDTQHGGGGGDTLFGGAGDDMLYGEAGTDTFWGGIGDDMCLGGAGDDLLRGNAGFDILNGGAGNDVYIGNFNADTFVFEDGFGADTIEDFEALNDYERIDLRGVSAITDFGDLSANHMTQMATDVLIDDKAGNTVLVRNASFADMNEADFVF